MRHFLLSAGIGFGLSFLLTGLADLIFHLQDHGNAEAIVFVTLGVIFTVGALARQAAPKRDSRI